jgi:precorrin-6B C5,15-methyltransferase / cobalt-precorrin-6B C5,C15-methyltransferase
VKQGSRRCPAASRLIVSFAETVIGPPRFLSQLGRIFETAAHPELVSEEAVGQRGLEAVARALLDNLEGDERSPRGAGGNGDLPTLIEWEGSLDKMLAQVTRLRDTPTVILASGDPMWFGIGATLARHLAPDEFEVHAYPSAFQLAAAAMRWPLQHVATLSLHGRPAELIEPHILPANRILALTTDAETAHHVAGILVNRGYPESVMTVLESLGGPEERTTASTAAEFDASNIGDFYVLAVDCVAGQNAALLPPVPGLPDEAFVNDGQLTKREIRAATIAKLAPFPGALLWDVGAGCGSVAIEWMRAARDAEAIAFEREGERLQMIAVNANVLGVPMLRIENGDVPQSLVGMPTPDAIFLGGAVADEAVFEACWSALKPGGRLVANAVTVAGEQALYARQALHGGELVRLETSVLDTWSASAFCARAWR